jgi:hypothetical protein
MFGKNLNEEDWELVFKAPEQLQLGFPRVWQEDWYCKGCRRHIVEEGLPDGTMINYEDQSGIVLVVWCICGETNYSDYYLSTKRK